MRPQAQAKAGFYPTPPRVTARIAAHIIASAPTDAATTIRILDPCAGQGTALAQLTASMPATIETYGIELDDDRATEARAVLTRCITSDFFTTRIKPQGFSGILLNPPYDFTGDRDRRLEHSFLRSATDSMATGGLMVLIIPQVRLISYTARHLAAYYDNIRVYKFQEPEYQAFKQIVVFGTRKADNMPNEATQKILERVPLMFETELFHDGSKGADFSTLPELPATPEQVYTLPIVPVEPFYFRSNEIDPIEAEAMINSNGIWSDTVKLAEIFAPQAAPVIRPLMPLKKGHLALLIASGFINNQVLDDGKLRLIIKGRSFKASHTVVNVSTEETDDGDEKDVKETIQKERFDTVISAFNLDTGAFMAIR